MLYLLDVSMVVLSYPTRVSKKGCKIMLQKKIKGFGLKRSVRLSGTQLQKKNMGGISNNSSFGMKPIMEKQILVKLV